jgi:hypothetical protein
MDNLARRTGQAQEGDLDGLIGNFMAEFAKIRDPARFNRQGNEFISKFPPERGLEIATALTFANPFFLPDIPAAPAASLAVSLDLFSEQTMRAKLAARSAGQLNLLVACAPKSASTFIQNALQNALSLPAASLFTASLNSSALGANLREQEPDELSLIRNGLNRMGYVAQHHARCTPYLARLLALYRIRPIVTIRNVYDTLVSLDDMLLEWRSVHPGGEGHYYDDAMPRTYATMDVEDRMTLLAARWPAWLTQFYISWKKCEKANETKPFWISYEDDFLAGKQALAARLAEWLGGDRADPDKLLAAFADTSQGKAVRLNKGVAGRGEAIPARIRARIEETVRAYGEDEDLAPLLGG